MSGKGKKKDLAKDGEPRIYTVPEPKYGGGKGMTLDILVRMRWATTASPAAPEALALLSNKITNEGNNSNDNNKLQCVPRDSNMMDTNLDDYVDNYRRPSESVEYTTLKCWRFKPVPPAFNVHPLLVQSAGTPASKVSQ